MNLNKMYATSGIISAAIFMTLWVIAAITAPNWHLGELSLSDLGVCGNNVAEISFNMGCALAGLFGVMFGIYVLNTSGYLRVTGVAMILSSIALTGVGVVNLNYGPMHAAVALTYAGFGAVSMIFSIIGDIKEGRKKYAIVTCVLILIIIIMQLTQTFYVYEPIDVTCFCIWAGVQSFKYVNIEIEKERVAMGIDPQSS